MTAPNRCQSTDFVTIMTAVLVLLSIDSRKQEAHGLVPLIVCSQISRTRTFPEAAGPSRASSSGAPGPSRAHAARPRAQPAARASAGAMSGLASSPPDALLSLPFRRFHAFGPRCRFWVVALRLWRCLVLLFAPEQHF